MKGERETGDRKTESSAACIVGCAILTEVFSLLIFSLPSAVDVIRSTDARSPSFAYSHNFFGII